MAGVVVRDLTTSSARHLGGLIVGTARALGEFGATLMVAGNIPGRTQTLPLAIYDAVQARRYSDVNFMVLVMTSLAFVCGFVDRLGLSRQKQEKAYVGSSKRPE